MVNTHVYYVKVKSGHGDSEIFLTGKVKPEVQDFGIMESGEDTWVGLKEPGTVSLDDLGLLEDGFRGGPSVYFSDHVRLHSDYPATGWYRDPPGIWVGTYFEHAIGEVISIWIPWGNPSFHWIYEPPAAQ